MLPLCALLASVIGQADNLDKLRDQIVPTAKEQAFRNIAWYPTLADGIRAGLREGASRGGRARRTRGEP